MTKNRPLVFVLALCSSPALAGQPKVDVCHLPPGDPTDFHTITVSQNAVNAHVSNHGDLVGLCSEVCDEICFDGDLCTQNCDIDGSTCYTNPPPVDCDDSNPATIDTCEPAVGCINTPVAEPERATSGANLTIGVEPRTPGNQLFGSDAAVLGDVNGDGVVELAVGERKGDPAGSSSTYRPGVVYIYKSPMVLDGSALLRNTADTRVIGLGTDGNGGLGNVDAVDGLAELALTDAPTSHPLGGLGAILRDFPDGDILSSTIGDGGTPASTRITGSPDTLFSSRPLLGHVTSDGAADLVLIHNIPNTGKTAQIWPGALPSGNLAATSTSQRLEVVGQAVSDAALVVGDLVDLTGDGRDDLVIAPSRQGVDYDYVDVIFGSDGPLTGSVHYASLLDGTSGLRIVGPSGSDFGTEIEAAGDVDGDGYDDLLVSERDGAWLLFGPLATGSASVSYLDLDPVHFTGITPSSSYGNHSRGVGDVDGDGYDDMLHCGTGASSNAGACWLVFGDTRASLPGTRAMADVVAAGGVLFSNDDALADWFGVSATSGDLDGDGHTDLVITAYPGAFVFAGPFR